jgi:hypothetical protein
MGLSLQHKRHFLVHVLGNMPPLLFFPGFCFARKVWIGHGAKPSPGAVDKGQGRAAAAAAARLLAQERLGGQ